MSEAQQPQPWWLGLDCPVPMLQVDAQGRVRAANPALLQAVAPHRLSGLDASALLDAELGAPPTGAALCQPGGAPLRPAIHPPLRAVARWPVSGADDDQPQWLVLLLPAQGLWLGSASAQAADLAARQAARESDDRLAKFMDASLEGIAFHRDGVVTDVNPPMAALIGRRREDMLGRHVLEFIAPDHLPRVRQGLAQPGPSPYEAALLDAAGQPVAVELLAREIHRDGLPLRMVVVRDIRDRQAARAQIQHLAEHDSLTGLRNRRSFMARLAAALDQHRAQRRQLALLFIDLDHFKRINDSRGHQAGDALLAAVAAQLRQALRHDAVAGRLGGDEFVVLLPGVAHRAEAMAIAARLQSAMAAPVPWQGQPLSVTPTIGVALFPADGDSADVLLRHADAALYAGKAAGRAQVAPFVPAMAEALDASSRLEGLLTEALQHGAMRLMLQPRLAADGGLQALQASLHWRHPQRGWTAATEVPGLARLGSVRQALVAWGLREALALQAGWAGQSVPLALNLGGLLPGCGALAAVAEQVLSGAALPQPALVLELDEALLADDRASVLQALQRLQALGFGLRLLDFGSGGAPLTWLRRLPLQGLVLDRGLVAALPAEPAAQTVVRAVLDLAHGLGWHSAASGVASPAQAQWLRGAGCQALQGPWAGAPMTLAQTQAWLTAAGQLAPDGRRISPSSAA